MAYQALYRKWRPDEFNEVKGQEHIVTTLKNQIAAERIGHAYLFCGTRGTGKTTVAKLFAKIVNCEHPVDGNPCNECPSCKAIAKQASMNVIEIDAASNNGVDNIREIRENVQYSPTQGKYKVYIIDEVHMLSMGAFNALLKTLEEPPAYVIFILATTEAHKIPITILSRCQRYDFKRISTETIAERLMDLVHREGMEAEEKAIRYVAKAADGSMRDGLSLLEQCIAFYLGEPITYNHVLEVLGTVDTEELSSLYRTIASNNVSEMLLKVDALVMQGREITQLVNDFTGYLRNIMLVKESDDLIEALDVSEENLELLREDAALCDLNQIMRYITVCSELANQLRYSTQKRVRLEVAFIKLCTPQMETDLSSVLERIRQLEDKVANGVAVQVVNSPVPASQVIETQSGPTKEDYEQHLQQRFEPAQYEDLKRIVDQLEQVQKKLDPVAKRFIKQVRLVPGAEGSEIRVALPANVSPVAKEYFESEPGRQHLEEVFSACVEKEVKVSCVGIPAKEEKSFEYTDLRSLIAMDIQGI